MVLLLVTLLCFVAFMRMFGVHVVMVIAPFARLPTIGPIRCSRWVPFHSSDFCDPNSLVMMALVVLRLVGRRETETGETATNDQIEMHLRWEIEIEYCCIGNESAGGLLLSEYEMSPPSCGIYNKDLCLTDKESRGVLRQAVSLTELRSKWRRSLLNFRLVSALPLVLESHGVEQLKIGCHLCP